MALSVSEFDEFFAAVHDGAAPFPWQRRLVERLVVTGRWPAQIAAPTGAGKTAVVDAHVFAVAAMVEGGAARLPRRLALVVPRRVLVDSQYDHACHIAELLRDVSEPSSVLGRVAAALWRLRWPCAPRSGTVPGSPLVIARLRGGLPAPRAWRDDPSACAVLSATPDMWGSRLLLHGYGSAPRARPREAGLLAMDAAVVVDEAHLARQLLETARAVSRLERTPPRSLVVPALQVVETTATPSSGQHDVLGVESSDLEAEILGRRLRSPKPLRLRESPHWPAAKGRARTLLVEEMVDEVVSLRARFGPTVGVFVNTVGLAVALAAALRKCTRPGGGSSLEVALVCGRLRNHDFAELGRRFPGLLTLTGNPQVDVLVATQSLEVGVDLDLAAALSELAPSQALTQRAGRVNRLGRRDATEFVVVGPDDESRLAGNARSGAGGSGPYDGADLTEAWHWLAGRASDSNGLSPAALTGDPPPTSPARRAVFQRVELADSWWWARTSDRLDPEVDLELWLADDLEGDLAEVGVVVRAAMPADPADAVALIRAMPPQEDEVFPAPLPEVRKLLEELGGRWSDDAQYARVLVRAGEVTEARSVNRLRPGDLVVLDATAPCFTEGVVDPDGRETRPDVSEALHGEPVPGEVMLRVEPALWSEEAIPLLETIGEILRASSGGRQTRSAIAHALEDYGDRSAMVGPVLALLCGRLKDVDVIPFWDDETLQRLVVADQRSAPSDEGARQVWTPSEQPPTLDDHAAAVARRARELASLVGLERDLVETLGLAGKHHDDGKADLRFQREVLGWGEGTPLLAKGSSDSARGTAISTLPAHWRHEQLSVVKADLTLRDRAAPDGVDLPLVLRLVGTSHGHGRVSFPHSADELGPLPGDEDQVARALYDRGEWDDLVERTQQAYGVWGVAYLEALLRAADGQVSGEGS